MRITDPLPESAHLEGRIGVVEEVVSKYGARAYAVGSPHPSSVLYQRTVVLYGGELELFVFETLPAAPAAEVPVIDAPATSTPQIPMPEKPLSRRGYNGEWTPERRAAAATKMKQMRAAKAAKKVKAGATVPVKTKVPVKTPDPKPAKAAPVIEVTPVEAPTQEPAPVAPQEIPPTQFADAAFTIGDITSIIKQLLCETRVVSHSLEIGTRVEICDMKLLDGEIIYFVLDAQDLIRGPQPDPNFDLNGYKGWWLREDHLERMDTEE